MADADVTRKPDPQDLGFVGLGNIGGALAANLVSDGHRLVVHDRDGAREGALVDAGARAAHDVAALAAATDVTFLSLPGPAIMEEVASRWLEGAREGAVLVDLTTNAPDVVRRVGAALARRGCALVEAPLTGGAPGARGRMLVFIVGGEPAAVQRVRPLLETLGRAFFHMGPLGTGNTAKLVNSLFAFATTWVSLEGLAICTRAGIDVRTMVEMVRAGGGGNMFITHMVEGLNQRGAPVQFALDLAAKDAGLLVDLARELGVPTPVAAEVAQALVVARALGFGARDFTDLASVMEALAGVELRIRPPA